MSFVSFLQERGVTNVRLTKSGRADRRNKNMAKLEDEWFNLSIKSLGRKKFVVKSKCELTLCCRVIQGFK